MLWLIIAVLIIIADQAVKYLVVSGMNVGDTAFSILNLFDILDKEKADTSAFVYINYDDVCRCIRQCNRQNFQRFCY